MSSHEASQNSGKILAELLKQNATRFGSKRAALRIKKLGIWREISWQEYLQSVTETSLGLTSIGASSGETVAILSGNSPTALYALIGSGAAGCQPLCIHRESTAAEVRELLVRFRISYLFAEDQEQVDKVLELSPLPESLHKIIYINPRGMGRYREPILISMEQLLTAGREVETSDKGSFDRMLSRLKPESTALICATSGSSGKPKGAMLSHSALLKSAAAFAAASGMKAGDEFVSFLPLSWFGEQMISVAAALQAGLTVNFPESAETVMADLREIGPQIMLATPQIWEGIASSVQVRMMESTPLKKTLFNFGMGLGRGAAEERLSGKGGSLSGSVKSKLAHLVLMRALKDRLGLSRVRFAATGGSALGEDVFNFFHSIGLKLKQVYGLTEAGGFACIQGDEAIRFGTVGKPLPGVEVSFSPSGEVLLKAPGLFSGYFTGEESPVKDGWLHTGDAGRLDTDGQLLLLDRLEDIFATADGSSVAPQTIEGNLKFSPYIADALLVGENRPYLAALVCVNGRLAGKWAADNKISYSGYSDLAAKPELYDFIAAELKKANDRLPPQSRIRKFTILYKELDADDSELTRTGKMRRGFVTESYRELIEALYSGADSLEIDRTIDLQEGRSARIQSRVLFRTLEPGA